MNCRTGEITDDPIVISEWLQDGDRVLRLPTVPMLGPEAQLDEALRDHAAAEAALRPRHESPLLHTLGGLIADAKQEADEATLRRAQAFVQQVNARTR